MIVGTAGHIDHGKSALVTALTGRAVDRLAEERRRGITIELNFAPLRLPGRPPIGIIDVPGHEDLIRTMVAGAAGVDLALLVVDAAEGPRPQTEEHLTILEQLRIPAAIPVFTKADLVDRDWIDLVVAELEPRLARSAVRFGVPAVVSAVTGDGVDALRARIAAAADEVRRDRSGARFRMPVDRVFSVAGVGTVVTGTTWAGALAVGDAVGIGPGTGTARVRSVEAYGETLARAEPGTRTALGLTGLSRDAVTRGDVVVTGVWRPTSAVDAEIELVPEAPRPLTHRTRVRIHQGTAEILARVASSTPIGPGGRGVVRLVLERPALLQGGDRLVLRSYSPVGTIGGGWVVDPFPPRRSRPDPALAGADRLGGLIARRPDGIEAELLPQLLGDEIPGDEAALADAKVVAIGSLLLHRRVLAAVRTEILAAVTAYHDAEPAEDGISVETLRSRLRRPPIVTDAVLDGLDRNGAIRRGAGRVAAAGFVPSRAGGVEAEDELVAFLERAGLAPPTVAEIETGVEMRPVGPALRHAMAAGRVQAVDRERYAATTALDGFVAVLRDLGRSGPITPAVVRDRLGLTRKFLIPLLEWADRRGVTRREGDARVLVQSGRPDRQVG
ncbi:MAG: selenocysteine-specific translation elongation factor [Gemmatimonadales bacterium]